MNSIIHFIYMAIYNAIYDNSLFNKVIYTFVIGWLSQRTCDQCYRVSKCFLHDLTSDKLKSIANPDKNAGEIVSLCSFAYGDLVPNINGFEKQEICINSICHLSGEKFYETVTFR